jgi:O-antigen/teichoic acid export membrane protein
LQPGILNKIKGRIQSKYVKNFLTIGFGTLVAQSILVVTSPLLSRLFSPEDFGVFANYTALTAFIIVINTGKYELAIIHPKEHKDAINIAALSFFILVLTTVGLTLLFVFMIRPITSWAGKDLSLSWIVLAPLGAFFANFYLIINEWYIRNDNYKGLGKNRIGNTSGITGVSIFFGLLRQNLGLIWGQICGQMVSIFLALRRIFSHDKSLLRSISKRKMKYFAVRHVNFAKYIIPGQLLNTASGLIAISLITFKFGYFHAGLIALVDRVFGIPSSVVGSAINDVFKLQITETYREKGNCLRVYKKVVFMLLAVAAIPFVLLYFISPALFPFIFGKDWVLAGKYAQVFCCMFFLNFLSMPTRWVFMVAEKQKMEFVWQVIFIVFSVVPIIAGIFYFDIFTTLILWSTGKSISYIIYIIMTYKITKNKLNVPYVKDLISHNKNSINSEFI